MGEMLTTIAVSLACSFSGCLFFLYTVGLFVRQGKDKDVREHQEKSLDFLKRQYEVFCQRMMEERRLADSMEALVRNRLGITKFDIHAAVAQGWCTPENELKEMDVELAEAIVSNVMKLIGKES